MKIQIIKYSIFFIILLIKPCCAMANDDDATNYQKWMNQSSYELLKKGDSFVKKNDVENALICFSIVSNRYGEDKSDEEKIECLHAIYGKWYVYFALVFDYAKAFDCLLNAKDIIDSTNLEYPKINLGYAVFFHTLAGQSFDQNLEEKALAYCRRGYHAALEKKDKKMLDIFFCNLMLSAEELGKISSLSKEWELYKKCKSEGTFNYDYNIIQYKARFYKSKNNFDEAHRYADKLIEISQKNGVDLRRINIAFFLKSKIYESQGDYESAINVIDRIVDIATENDFKDCRLETYNILSKYYEKLGESHESDMYTKKYYLLKDSIINLKQMTNLNKMAFVREIKKMDNEINEMKYKRSMQIFLFILISIFSLILLSFVKMLFSKNRQLKEKNRKLYEQYLKMINSEDKEFEKIKSDSGNRDTEQEEADEKEEEKYRNSSLSEEAKNILHAKILKVMDNIDEICSVSFSGERLAQLTDSQYKYVSQVINEKYGCNFNMFLNKFRIKEACRRFADDTYGKYTIDAMSKSLGFKSRTTFTSSFKKTIGLTPSQYFKLANEDKDKKLTEKP